MQRRASEEARREKSKGDAATLTKIAEQIAHLIIDPAIMQKWQNKVIDTLNAIREYDNSKQASTEDPWPFSHKSGNPDIARDLTAVYTLLALLHDDTIGRATTLIISDQIKGIYPKQCEYPFCCDYMRYTEALPIYMRYVKNDLNITAETQDRDEGIIPITPQRRYSLKPFMKSFCVHLAPAPLEIAKNRLLVLHRKNTIQLPTIHGRSDREPVPKPGSGKAYYFLLTELLSNWECYHKADPQLIPSLKPDVHRKK